MQVCTLLVFLAFLQLVVATPVPPHKYCNVSTSEIAALHDLYMATEGHQWIWYRIDGIEWSFDDPHPNPCFPVWQGLVCNTLNVTAGYNCTIISLVLYTCNLKGTIPDTIDNLPNLIELDLYNNHLNGSIPNSLSNLTKLEVLNLDANLLTGEIPETLASIGTLRSIDLGGNYLSGEIPTNLLSSVHLQYLLLYSNHLTGTLDNLNLPRVVQIDFSSNFLEGLLSTTICYKRLQYLALSTNMFTGSLPSCIYAHLFYVDLSYNSLIGNIEHTLSLSIEYLILNNNQFTGSIPLVLQQSQSNELIINNNYFTGAVPVPSVDLAFLYVQNNLLSGSIVATNWTNSSIAYVDLSNNEITGSLPAVIFSTSPLLVSFAASSNCITGEIPVDICKLQDLLYLGLDGLGTAKSCRHPIFPGINSLRSFTLAAEISGGIPKCLFSMSALETLHLSGNSITWSFPSDVSVSEKLMSLSLSHNKITGTIPAQIQSKQWDNLDLSYNKLVGKIDSDVNLDVDNSTLVLQVNRLSGKIPHSILDLESINVLTGNLFFCDLARDQLPVNDVAYTIYQCGSNSFNQASIVWCCLAALTLGFLFLTVRKRCIKRWNDLIGQLRGYLREFDDLEQYEKLLSFRKSILLIMKCVMIVSFVALAILLPIYAVLTHFFRTVEYQYAWTVSAAFLSGTTPAIVLLLLYLTFLLLLFGMWLYVVEQPIVVEVDTPTDVDRVTWRQFTVLSTTVFVNCILMSLVNVGYILVILNCDAQITLAAQLMTALFKLLWNDFGVRYMMLFSRRFYHTIRNKELEDVYARQEMPYMTFIVLFNCIIAPCLATAAVDSDCFYNVFVAPAAVASAFPIVTEVSTCYEIGKANHTKFLCGNATQSVTYMDISYDPPFIYSYQCSSSILTNYASVYVYMFLMVAFVKPIVLMLMVRWYGSIPKGSLMHLCIDNSIYKLLKPVNEKRLNKRVLFHSERLVLRSVGKIAVLLTFGVVFPPLAVVLCVAFITETYGNLVIMGRFLSKIKETEFKEQFKEKLNRDCQDCMNLLLVPLVRLVVPFAACFYAFFVFDIYGDKVGFKKSIWAPVLLIASPMLIWMVYSLYLVYIRKTNAGIDEGKKQTELVMVENVLLSKEIEA